jgi:hypothetical protein
MDMGASSFLVVFSKINLEDAAKKNGFPSDKLSRFEPALSRYNQYHHAY